MRKLQVLTNSEVEAHDGCPAMHGYGYHELLRPKLTGFRLSRGTIGHAGLAAGWRRAWDSDTYWLPIAERIELATRAAQEAIAAAVVRAEQEIRANSQLEGAEELLTELEESKRICEFVCSLYFKTRAEELDPSRFIPLAIEQPFEILLRNSRGNVTTINYSGVIDLVLLDLEANAIRVEDHKFPERPGLTYERRLPLATQMSGYVYAVRELAKLPMHSFWEYGRGAMVAAGRAHAALSNAQVGAVAYNLIKARLPAQPAINQNGQVSIAKLDTLPEIYSDALFVQASERNIPITEKQHEFLGKLKLKPPWITKVEYYRGEEEIQRWLAETCIKAAQIRESERRPELRVRRSGHCTGVTSARCSFESVCMDPTSQHTRDTFYRVATSRHEEIEAIEQNGSEKEAEPW